LLLPELGAGLDEAGRIAATEGALPQLSLQLLPPVLIGFMLAGLFSATMSTADSQILSCSAAITQDAFPRLRDSRTAAKAATLGVAALSLVIALVADSGVFSLVLTSWTILGSAFGPLLVVRVFRRPLSNATALTMMLTGVVTVFLWRATGLSSLVYEALPGLCAPFMIYGVSRATHRDPVRFTDHE
jgi:sodium/proline symporter